MGWVTAVAIFFVIWWTVLFVVLPFGVRTQGDDGSVVPGSADSAPTIPHLGRKVLATTFVSALVFVLFYVLTQIVGIGVDSFPRIIPGT